MNQIKGGYRKWETLCARRRRARWSPATSTSSFRSALALAAVVLGQVGDDIRRSVEEVLRENGVESARVSLVDRGALDCVIRARVETAIARAKGE